MKTGKSLQDLAIEIERQVRSKKDYVAKLDAVTMVAKDGTPRLHIEGRGHFGIKEIAHNQIAEHVKIPRPYYDRMRKEAPELLATNVDEWFRRFPAPQMIRTLDGDARAMLSPSYQALDNYDFAGAALPILAQRKLRVMSCDITDRRFYIKAVDEQLFRDVPVGFKMGDGSHRIFSTCAPAVILSNSEVGFGRLVVETGVYEQACTNLALFAKGGMKRTHVGARHRLTEGMDVEDLEAVMTSATKRKTMEALWLQVRDVLAKLVGDVMTTPVVAASPLTDIRRIARVMLDRDVDGVPIVNEAGVLLGFVSRSDILRAVVTDPPLSMWR